MAKLRWRLFPPPTSGAKPSWLPELAEEVRRQIEAMTKGAGDPRSTLSEELKRLDDQTQGWLMSLGNASLPPSTRTSLEGLLAEASGRRSEVMRQLAELESTRASLDTVLDEDTVIEKLRRLEEVLASGNVAAGNRELKRLIERVACHSDGRIELRTRRQGLFEGATAWLHRSPATGSHLGPSPDLPGNDGHLYWTDPLEYSKPKRIPGPSWARDHAREVLAKSRETNWNSARLAKYFEKGLGTIKRALELAQSALTNRT